MLNTRFFIVPSEDKTKQIVQRNPDAYGPAWFVSEYKIVPTPDEEMAALSTEHLGATAIIDRRFASDELKALPTIKDSTATISLKHYQPNEAVYETNSTTPQLALFSEVYYPKGWKVYLDGDPKQSVNMLRADWILRAAVIPSGAHTITFRFDPPSLHRTELIAFIAFILLILLFVAAITVPLLQKRTKQLDNQTTA